MPPLVHYEEIDDCEVYCVAHVYLQPSDHELWRSVNKFSTNKYHYRHDYLKRGICLDSCTADNLKFLKNSSSSTHILRLVNSSELFLVSLEHQEKAASCINSRKLSNGLNAFVNVSFCNTKNLDLKRKGIFPQYSL